MRGHRSNSADLLRWFCMLMAAEAAGARQDHRKPSAASAQPNDASQAAIVRFRGDRTMSRQIGQSQAVGYRERPMCPVRHTDRFGLPA
jgi:hypothetical protein